MKRKEDIKGNHKQQYLLWFDLVCLVYIKQLTILLSADGNIVDNIIDCRREISKCRKDNFLYGKKKIRIEESIR